MGFANETWQPKTYEWYTPAWIFDRIGLTFDLDPASPGADVVPWIPATSCYTRHDDGLARPWFGRVWLNPPYGNLTPAFMGRLADHGDGIALVLARTDTRWFHRAAADATLLVFCRGRLDLVPGVGQRSSNPQAGTVFFAFGDECAAALEGADLGTAMHAGVRRDRQLRL